MVTRSAVRVFFVVCLGVCGLVLHGCQKLPPGVLAGSRETSLRGEVGERQAVSVGDDAVQGAELDERLEPTNLESRVASLEAELAAVREDRDHLRDQLTTAIEHTLATQTELLELYRDQAVAAKTEMQRLRSEIRVADEPVPQPE